MGSSRTEALILRSVDFGESDRILHLLVPESGRLTAIAKGARRSVRRFGGTLDLFNHLSVQVWKSGKASMARLEQAQLIEAFGSLRADSARFALGCYLLELLDRLAPEGGAPADMARLFRFALGSLGSIAARPASPRLRVLLELRALDALGLRPELARCVRCGEEPDGSREVGFHVRDGGVVCGPCGNRLEGLLSVHRGTLRALEQALRFDQDRLDRLVLGPQILAEAELLLRRFHHYHVGVDLRSERFLDEMLRPVGSAPAA